MEYCESLLVFKFLPPLQSLDELIGGVLEGEYQEM